MKEIAERCQVSKSLVSRVLNQDPSLRITNETRQRILEEVERQGYIKNGNAQALSASRRKPGKQAVRIGYVTFASYKYPGHPYFSHIIDGVTEEAVRLQCQLALETSVNMFNQNLSSLMQQYRENKLDGLILMGKVTDIQLRKAIPQIARHVVSMDGTFDKNADYVGVNVADSLLLPLQHLLLLGYTDIGVLSGPDYRDKFAACARLLAERGIAVNQDWVINGEYSIDITREKVEAQLRTMPPPRAIMAFNDEMAIGCIKSLKDHGYAVPDRVAVTGHDDISLAAYVDVPLTTVRIYKKEMGRLAVKILLDRIENNRKNPVFLELPGKLIKRDSCGYRSGKA